MFGSQNQIGHTKKSIGTSRKNFNFKLEANKFYGICGPSGCGKSTLLKVICGLTESSEGESSIGPSIKAGYFSQFSLDLLNPENTVLEEISSRLPQASNGYIRNLLAAFLFRGDDVEKKIKVLSGGEKSRVVLATLMSNNNNLLILDEPTNHLDLESITTLNNSLSNFKGNILLASHDHEMLSTVCNRIIELTPTGIIDREMTYDEYLADKKVKKPTAAKPSRIRPSWRSNPAKMLKKNLLTLIKGLFSIQESP